VTVALISIAVLGLLVFGLGFATSMLRGRANIVGVVPQDPTSALYKIQRAHGNTTEYAPYLALLIFVLGSRDPATWVLWCMGIVTLARCLIVAGLLLSKSLDDAHPLRFVGALLTYLGGFALCGALVASL
jgi:uncharacterized membrane protein YecN with MAPEG domain